MAQNVFADLLKGAIPGMKMKWHWMILLALAAFGVRADDNLLIDGGFEKGSYGKNWVLPGWGDYQALAKLDGQAPYAGGNSLRVDVESRKTGSVFVWQNLAPLPAGRYRISFRMKGQGDLDKPVRCVIRGEGKPYRSYLQDDFKLTGQWKQYVIEDDCDEIKEKAALIISLSPDRKTTYWLDDVVLEKVPDQTVDPVANMLKDGGFEKGGAYGKGWLISGWGENKAQAKLDSTAPRSGQNSLRIEVESRRTGSIFVWGQLKELKAGRYRISFWMKGTGDNKPVNCLVRGEDYPYRRYLSGEFVPEADWREYSFEGDTIDAKERVALIFSLAPDRKSTFWLDDVELKKLPDQVAVFNPADFPGNLIPNGDFEVYPFAQWVRQQGTVETVTTGDGKKALEMNFKAGYRTRLESTCFIVPTENACQFSTEAEVEGAVNLTLSLFSAVGGKKVAELAVKPSPEQSGKMNPFSSEIKLAPGAYYCQLEANAAGDGRVRIDRIALTAVGDTRIGPVDAAILSDRAADIFTPGAPVSLTLELFKHLPPADRQWRFLVRDFAGNIIHQAAFDPGADAGFERRQLTFPVGKTGSMMAELKCRDRIVAAKNFTILPEPNQTPAEQSLFGGHFHANPFEMEVAKRMGLKWVRIHDSSMATCWNALEPERGKWVFQDRNIDLFVENGFMVLGVLLRTPAWANHGGKPAVPPADMADFTTYARKTAEHYRNSIRYWEIWNEPYLKAFWDGTPEAYAALAKAGAEAIKAGNPEATVLSMVTAPSAIDFSEPALRAGAMSRADVLSFHGYSEFTPKNYPNIRNWAGGKPCWNTETGIMAKSFYRHLPEVVNDYTLTLKANDPATAVEEMVKSVALSLGFGSQRYFYYWNVVEPSFGGRLSSMCIFEHDRSLRPHAAAYAVAVNLLDRCRGEAVWEKNGLTGVLLQKDASSIIVWWHQASDIVARIPGNAGDLRILDAMGNELPTVKTPEGLEVKLGKTPVYTLMPSLSKAEAETWFSALTWQKAASGEAKR